MRTQAHINQNSLCLASEFSGLVSAMLFLLLVGTVEATKVYQEPVAFLKEQFNGEVPPAKIMHIPATLQKRIQKLNGSPYSSSRVRYWRKGEKTLYILEDIGKTQPITMGYVLVGGRIYLVKVLIYRESHGFEVARSYFTRQFKNVALKRNGRLTKRPANIVGATLSVRSLTRMARVALLLNSQP